MSKSLLDRIWDDLAWMMVLDSRDAPYPLHRPHIEDSRWRADHANVPEPARLASVARARGGAMASQIVTIARAVAREYGGTV